MAAQLEKSKKKMLVPPFFCCLILESWETQPAFLREEEKEDMVMPSCNLLDISSSNGYRMCPEILDLNKEELRFQSLHLCSRNFQT